MVTMGTLALVCEGMPKMMLGSKRVPKNWKDDDSLRSQGLGNSP